MPGQEVPNVERDPMYDAPYAWYVSFGVGGASGSNPIGTFVDTDGSLKSFTFSIGDGGFFGVRAGKRVWWRLGVEGEFGWGSPGVEVTEANLNGTGIETSEFAEYSFGLFDVAARLDLTDSRITPFLIGGAALVFSRIDSGSGTEGDTNPGFIFGGGLDVRIKDNVNFRGDIRGLRSKVDADRLTRGVLLEGVDESGALSTMWIYSFGVSIRFD